MLAAVIITIACFAAVPYVMGKNGWEGHDRSGRYTMFAVATDYLNSCAPNAILFTNGDNDTFPLWYAQEVIGCTQRCEGSEFKPSQYGFLYLCYDKKGI